MNKIVLVHKTKCFLTICKLLSIFDCTDIVKLCLMTSAILQINRSGFHNINDFFQVFANNLRCNQKEMTQIIKEIEFLEKNKVIKIEDNKASIIVITSINSIDLQHVEIELLKQINEMKIESMVRFIVQYV